VIEHIIMVLSSSDISIITMAANGCQYKV